MTDSSPGARVRLLVDQGVTPDAYGLLPAHADLVDELVEQHGTLVLARRAIAISVDRIGGRTEMLSPLSCASSARAACI